jgi:hypothetical protein
LCRKKLVRKVTESGFWPSAKVLRTMAARRTATIRFHGLRDRPATAGAE